VSFSKGAHLIQGMVNGEKEKTLRGIDDRKRFAVTKQKVANSPWQLGRVCVTNGKGQQPSLRRGRLPSLQIRRAMGVW